MCDRVEKGRDTKDISVKKSYGHFNIEHFFAQSQIFINNEALQMHDNAKRFT